MNQIQHIKNILSIDECNLLVDYIKETESNNLWTETTGEFYKDRIEEIFLVRNEACKNILRNVYYELKKYIPEDQEADAFHLVRWPEGSALGVHYDDELFPYRKTSIVIYLNDNYEGGETCFVLQKSVMEPQIGHAIIFPATEEYLHFVATVTKGTRYTIAGFWTDDESNKIYWPESAGQSR